MNRRLLLLLAAFAVMALPLTAQSPAPSETAEQTHHSRVIVPWRHFGPQPGGSQQTSNIPQPNEAQPAADQAPNPGPDQSAGGLQNQSSTPNPGSDQAGQPDQSAGAPGTSATGDSPTDTSAPAGASPELAAASRVAALSEDYAKREQDRDARRQELEAAAHNDPTVQALADIQTTRLLLEGEQDRMQSSGQLSQAFSDLATKLQSDAERVRTLLEARRKSAEQADAEIARINSEAPDVNLALKNLALLPGGGENDEFMRSLASQLNQDDETLKIDQKRSQEDRAEIKGLEADEQELIQASGQARAKAASFAQASEDAKVNQGLLADRLEFSVQRKRASDELSDTTKILETSVSMRSHTPVQQAAPGERSQMSAQTPAQTPDTASQPIDGLRDCIRRTGDVAACRAAEGGQP
jgi:hypothetical protein